MFLSLTADPVPGAVCYLDLVEPEHRAAVLVAKKRWLALLYWTVVL